MSHAVRIEIGAMTAAIVVVALLLLLAGIPIGRCQPPVDGGGSASSDDAISQYISETLYTRLQNISGPLSAEIGDRLDYCIVNREKDWNDAFNFSSNLTFLSECIKTTDDLGRRICTSAEIKFYFNGLYGNGESSGFLKPNKNCNLTSWVSGCEPGWACSSDEENMKFQDSKEIPGRKKECQPCCEGFFCPRGITCMMPCPLGSYCPSGKLNSTTGLCSPYNYQLPSLQPNHTCGGADIWADINTDSDIFCPAGYYCPTTTKRLPCEPGHYCRMGSTSMQRCYKKSSCKAMSATQDITLFGLLLIAALGLLLLIIYNFSDQILTSRERQQAKSREAAARSARETVQARERWKAAKDVARKHALGFQSQLSRTFSRKKSVRQAEALKVGGQNKLGTGDTPLWSMASCSSSTPTGKDMDPSNLNETMLSHEDRSDNEEAYNLENGEKNPKRKIRKGKAMHTRSQIFKYAYGQIEKEKALQQANNLTFSGVIALATNTEIRKRHEIEVAFINLNITLKGKRKTLMRCVTGKLMPGRMTAVMGPSGAGKTTFLNALTGKITGCEMSGSILVNGKPESLRSYKKIIGFVPQDDIVHGNLTVEENLWFSAKCRLPADMPKADKVLVLERVIESLGLQAVRDSLVGTIEKRGISGGQRKRVNVGLEMVMEPSLLILDEPTSGLDSSSSQLLLRALRRETLERVNIVLVVHQPSYTLFQMFDDLILLAKGGLIAYHGPVKKVEEYFSGLGIHVPDRVNPPDHYIDILEGIVKPSTSSGINYKQLPVKWMQHNGYDIPPDMVHDLIGVDSLNSVGISSNGTGNSGPAEVELIAGEVWGDIKCVMEQNKDHIHNNYRKSKDLSNRITAGIPKQYKYFLGRVSKQRLRESRIQFVDFLILLLAGVCLGTLAKVSDESFGAAGYTYTVIAVSLLCKIGALRSFSLDKLHYWRESSSGMSSLAYFLAKDTIDHFNTLIKPIVYLSMFYFFNNPRSSITDNYVILLSLVYCVTGIAYWFAIFLQPSSAQLWSVLLPVVLTLISTQKRSGIVRFLANLCYPKWALQAFVISNAQRYSGVWLITRCGALQKSGYNIDEWRLCILILFVYGLVFRILAYFCLITFKKR